MRTNAELEQEIEASGVARDAKLFPIRLREAQLRRCQEVRGVSKCSECGHYTDCELVKAHLVDVRYVLPSLQKELADEKAASVAANPWLTML